MEEARTPTKLGAEKKGFSTFLESCEFLLARSFFSVKNTHLKFLKLWLFLPLECSRVAEECSAEEESEREDEKFPLHHSSRRRLIYARKKV